MKDFIELTRESAEPLVTPSAPRMVLRQAETSRSSPRFSQGDRCSLQGLDIFLPFPIVFGGVILVLI